VFISSSSVWDAARRSMPILSQHTLKHQPGQAVTAKKIGEVYQNQAEFWNILGQPKIKAWPR